MKKITLFLLTVISLTSACKKGATNDPIVDPVASKCRIISVTQNNDPATTYSYDEKGRISKVTNLYGFGTGTFTYESNKVVFTDITGAENQSFEVDAQGRITSDEQDIYKYNSDGFLFQRYWASVSLTIPEFQFSYTNGNLTNVLTDNNEIIDISYDENEPSQNLLGYESALYSSLILNQHTFSSFTAQWVGKGSKNLVKSIVRKRNENGRLVQVTEDYKYTKDAEGKVVSMTITHGTSSNNDNGIYIYRFTYDCQ